MASETGLFKLRTSSTSLELRFAMWCGLSAACILPFEQVAKHRVNKRHEITGNVAIFCIRLVMDLQIQRWVGFTELVLKMQIQVFGGNQGPSSLVFRQTASCPRFGPL